MAHPLRTKVLLCLGIGLLSAAAVSAGTETGGIRGRVADAKGDGLPGVEVRVSGPALQGERAVPSSRTGEFRFPLLPVGVYRVSFRLPGFEPAAREGVAVKLGETTALSAVLEVSSLKNEVTVTAPAPLVDRSAPDTSYHITAAALETLPALNRTVVDAMKLVPGTVGVRVNTRSGTSVEGQPSLRGEGQEGNSWIVDGLPVSGVRLRNSGVALNVDAIEEIQVLTDPFGPEFGFATGGVVNMVTKSGSDEWHGDVALVLQDKGLQAGKRDQLSAAFEPASLSRWNGYVNLGGPILKDKLWFFLSDNHWRNVEETRAERVGYLDVPAGRKETQENNLFAKLTFAPAQNHSVSLTGILAGSLGQEGGLGLPEMYDEERFRDGILRLSYKGILGPSTWVEAGFGAVRRRRMTEPVDGDLGPAMRYVEDLGRNVANSYGHVVDDMDRFDAGAKITTVAETPDFGRHELSAGVEYFRYSSEFGVGFTGQDEQVFPGDGFDAGAKLSFASLRDGVPVPAVLYEYGVFDFLSSSRGLGLYVRDKVTAGRFSLMLGLRSGTQSVYDDRGKALWSWGIRDFLSPRATLAWDVGGDGRTVLKAGIGRFADLITTMPLGFFNTGAGLTFRTYTWTGPSAPSEAELHAPANWTFRDEQKLQAFQVAKGLKPNFLTRLLLEADRQLGSSWAVKARFVRTWARDLLEVLAVVDPVTTYKFLYDNFEHKRRDYWGLELEVEGRLGRRGFVGASYVRSSAKGTNPGQSESGAWSQEEGSTNYFGLFGNHIYIPNLPEYAGVKAYYDWALGGLGGRGIGDEGWYGPLPYCVDHDVKLHGAWAGPAGVTAAAEFEWLSGYHWEKLGWVPFFAGYYSFPEGRGGRTTPAHAYLDVSLEKSFGLGGSFLGGGARVSLRADVLNALNSQQPIAFVKENIPLFGSVWGRQMPRQARLTLKMSF